MRPTQKRMRDGKVNHLQNTYTNQKILLRQELFPTEWHPTCHRHQIAPISHNIGTEQQTQLEQRTQDRKRFKNTRFSTIRLQHKNLSTFTNKQINWNTQFKTLDSHNQNTDKPDYSSWQQITTHTQQSHLPFLQTSLTNGIPSPTFLTRKVLNCFKKKKKQEKKRERETGAPRHNTRPQPLRGQSRKRGRKGRNPVVEDRGIKLLQYLPDLRVDKDTTIFYPISQTFFFSLLFSSFWTWRTSTQFRFFDTWPKRHLTSVESSWVRSSSYLSSYGPGLLTPRVPWTHLLRSRFKSKQFTNPNQVIRQHLNHNGRFQSHNTPSASRSR